MGNKVHQHCKIQAFNSSSATNYCFYYKLNIKIYSEGKKIVFNI